MPLDPKLVKTIKNLPEFQMLMAKLQMVLTVSPLEEWSGPGGMQVSREIIELVHSYGVGVMMGFKHTPDGPKMDIAFYPLNPTPEDRKKTEEDRYAELLDKADTKHKH